GGCAGVSRDGGEGGLFCRCGDGGPRHEFVLCRGRDRGLLGARLRPRRAEEQQSRNNENSFLHETYQFPVIESNVSTTTCDRPRIAGRQATIERRLRRRARASSPASLPAL